MGGLNIGPAFWALAALGIVAAVAYGTYFLSRPSSFVRALVKTVFMAAFAAALISAGAPFPLVAAAAFSAIGDFFLAFDKKWVLPLGIVSFLLAQLLYVVMFTAIWFFSGDNVPLWPRYAAMAAVSVVLIGFLIWFWRIDEVKRAPVTSVLAIASLVAFGALVPIYIFVAMSFTGAAAERPPLGGVAPYLVFAVIAVFLAWFRRNLGAIALAAMVYAGVITTMALASMWLPWVGWPAMVGAAIFMLSDLVLAGELFRLPGDAPARRITAPLVWWTYVAAHVLIITGVALVVLEGS